MGDDPLQRLREICLALPEAVEKETWGHPTFRIRDKMFATFNAGGDRPSLTCKAPPGSQAILVGADPERFFVPPYVGGRGWIGMTLDRGVDWREVAQIIARSFAMTAPKRLLRQRGTSR